MTLIITPHHFMDARFKRPPELYTEFTCKTCLKKLSLRYFQRNKQSNTGFRKHCNDCFNAKYFKNIDPNRKRKFREVLIPGQPRSLDNQTEKVQRIAWAYIENPKATHREISKATGIPITWCKELSNTNSYLSTLRIVASRKMTKLIPRALKSVEEALTSSNEDVKFRSAVKVLDNERVLGPERIDVTVNDLRHQSNERLQELVKAGQGVAEQVVIDAEVIS